MQFSFFMISFFQESVAFSHPGSKDVTAHCISDMRGSSNETLRLATCCLSFANKKFHCCGFILFSSQWLHLRRSLLLLPLATMPLILDPCQDIQQCKAMHTQFPWTLPPPPPPIVSPAGAIEPDRHSRPQLASIHGALVAYSG